MAIRIQRNEAGNCINFHGTSNPTYWNACLSGEVDSLDANSVNVINDIITAQTGEVHYEFFRVPFTEFVDADGNSFTTAEETAQYITEKANVIGNEGGGIDSIGSQMCFSLDATSTSIIIDNGYSFGVNTIKAVPDTDGTIHIKSISGDITHFYHLEVGNICIDEDIVSGGLNDVANALNELFTVGAFQSVVITDPEATIIADVNGVSAAGTNVGSNVVDPLGDDVLGTTATHNNAAGFLSTGSIDQAGEYFTFDIAGKATYGFGLVHTQESYDDGHYNGNASYADPAGFCVGANSSHLGYQFSHHFHIGNAHASWTNYGANTSYVMGEAWHDHNNRFDLKEEWNAGDPVKVKVGISELGFITISTLNDDGVNWRLHARSAYPVPEGSSFRLGVKLQTTGARLRTQPKIHLREPAAPELNFRFIESPDGVFQYPLFATEEEANYYDSQNSGAGESHTHIYADDPTSTTWYMPETNAEHNGTAAPLFDLTLGQPATYTEITSLSNSDLAPSSFSDATLTVNELSTVNYQTQPQDTAYTTSFSGLPSGLSDLNGGIIGGTAPEVAEDNVANPSDTYTVTVTRTNSYGSSSGTLTIIVNNLTAPPVVAIEGVTHIGGTAMINSETMDDGSVIEIDESVGIGERFVIDKEWLDNYVLPKITSGSGSKSVWIGFVAQNTTVDYTAIDRTDFRVAYEFNCDDNGRANNNWRLKTHVQGASYANVGIGSLTSGLYDYVFINDDTTVKAGALVASQGHNASTKVFDPNDGDWRWTLNNGSNSGSHKIIIATVNTDLDLDLQYFNEYTEPVASSLLTSWSKALDFSGSSERTQMVTSSTSYNPIMMAGTNNQVAAPSAGQTVSNGHPWATAIVFKADGNNSNQHIWNLGEGAGSTDDNIYLRMSSSRELYFGWGRDGDIAECLVADISGSISGWHGVYIAHNGTRYGSGATTAQMAACFDIRYTRGNLSWTIGSNVSTSSNWNGSCRMNRQYQGSLTIGGRGANRNFHGKVASMVVTTLRCNVAMPTDAEVEMMITDPMKWVQDYKAGLFYRQPQMTANSTNFQIGSTSGTHNPSKATQIWLMGDGANDSYSNMIRNQINAADQNYTKMNMISMVSNDIQNVTIQGLS